MTTLRQAAQQALEALERYQVKRQDFDRFADEIAALKAALEQPEQEPVTQWTGCGECDCTFPCHNGEARCVRLQPEPAHGDIRALKYRIHELEGEVIGYKRIIEEAALKKLADLGQEIEQEPVAWMNPRETFAPDAIIWSKDDRHPEYNTPLYTTPPAAQPTYPLPDDLYESKDWRAAGNYAERVEWLHVMYESKKQELEAYLDAQRKPLTDDQMWVIWNAQGIDDMNQPEAIAFARAIEAAHGIKESKP